MKEVNVWELKRRAKQYYPNSLRMQSAWLRQSVNLYANNKHALQTGGWAHGKH